MGRWAPRGRKPSSEAARAQREFRHARTGGAASPLPAAGGSGAGETPGKQSRRCRRASRPSPAGTAALRRPRRRVWQQGRTEPVPALRKEGRAGGRGGSARSTSPLRAAAAPLTAPPVPRRAAPSGVRARRGGSRCRGGGSGGGRCWRANRGPARRRESLAGAQGGRAAAIRAPRGRPPPVYVSGCRLHSSAPRPQRLPARAPRPRRGYAAGPAARRAERLGRQARRGAEGGPALLDAAAAARPWLPARRRRRWVRGRGSGLGPAPPGRLPPLPPRRCRLPPPFTFASLSLFSPAFSDCLPAASRGAGRARVNRGALPPRRPRRPPFWARRRLPPGAPGGGSGEGGPSPGSPPPAAGGARLPERY